MEDAQVLLDLNRLTFEAESRPEAIEGKAWDTFLSDVLSDDFVGRRGKPSLPLQGRDAFVAFAREASDAPRNIVGEPTVWVDGHVGVVSCDVQLGEDDTVWFRNVKVFVRHESWQCVYWQVTSFERTVA